MFIYLYTQVDGVSSKTGATRTAPQKTQSALFSANEHELRFESMLEHLENAVMYYYASIYKENGSVVLREYASLDMGRLKGQAW